MRDLAADPMGILLGTLEHATGRAGDAATAALNQPTVTDWVQAVVGAATLLTAIVAGLFAWRAAHWTKNQAIAAARQVDVALEGLEVAKNDAAEARALADDQRREATLAARRLAEDRVDVQMPTVLIRATPGTSDRWFLEERGDSYDDWRPVTEQLELNANDRLRVLRLSVTFHLENLSDRIARVVLLDAAWGEHTTGPDGVLLRPHAEATFDWSRTVTSMDLRDDATLAQLANTRPKLWVRDLGMNAYDVVDVVLNLYLARRDGSRVYVSPSNGWSESIGTPLPGRVYDRLNAAAAAGD